jgi:hypothetical protein
LTQRDPSARPDDQDCRHGVVPPTLLGTPASSIVEMACAAHHRAAPGSTEAHAPDLQPNLASGLSRERVEGRLCLALRRLVSRHMGLRLALLRLRFLFFLISFLSLRHGDPLFVHLTRHSSTATEQLSCISLVPTHPRLEPIAMLSSLITACRRRADLRPCSLEVQPIFWSVPGSSWPSSTWIDTALLECQW